MYDATQMISASRKPARKHPLKSLTPSTAHPMVIKLAKSKHTMTPNFISSTATLL